MPDRIDTLEVFEHPQTTGDLWDEINREFHPFRKTLSFKSDEKYTIRLLGPFVLCHRFYNGHFKLVKKYGIDLDRIASEDQKYFDSVINSLNELIKKSPRNKTSLHELGKSLFNIFSNAGTKCIMSNAYIKEGESTVEPKIKIVTLTKSICTNIAESSSDASVKISGLRARDLVIQRKGSGLQTRFEVQLKTDSFLSENAIKIVMANGLIDIIPTIKDLNRKNGVFYYKFPCAEYKMPEELTKTVFSELKETEEIKHLSKADEKINDVPRSAFERLNKPMGAIDSLEVI